MYNASAAFHEAVANGEHQIALLIFDDAVFTNDDINVTKGIEFNDYFNTEENIAIGQALSNEISFSIFNDHRLLNNYAFGDFTATIGAQIEKEEVPYSGWDIQAHSANNTYTSYTTIPYLRRNGYAVSVQPSHKVVSILIYDGIVYCLLENGSVRAYKDSDGSTTTVSLNSFMLTQMQRWEKKGISYADRMLNIWHGNVHREYEFVPLGRFNAERPNVPYVNEIQFTCYDLMQRFEKDMPAAAELGMTYPATIGTLFTKMCQYVDVEYSTNEFINSTAIISEEPEEFKNALMREVLKWIAEAAASNARFDRDGLLIFDWVKMTPVSIDENRYIEFNPYWYETQKVTKIYNRASNGSYETTNGHGAVGYLIQDNPLLKGVS